MFKRIFFILFFISIFIIPSKAYSKDISVGAYYFPGWSESNSIAWYRNGSDIRKKYPHLEPLMGWKGIDSVRFLKKEVEIAEKYGIDFFAIDWYWDFKKKSEFWDYAVKNFKKLGKTKTKFSLMWANHYSPEEASKNIKDYIEIVDYWKKNYLFDKNYLKTPDGKPIIFIFSPWQLERELGLQGAVNIINYMKTQANAYVIVIDNADFKIYEKYNILGFDAIVGWNNLYTIQVNGNSKFVFYSTYKNAMEKLLNQVYLYNTNAPIYPSIIPGWDERPWVESPSITLINNNPKDFNDLLFMSKTFLNLKNYKFNMIMIESWNEFGEGAYIIPTKKWKYEFLENIKNIK
jgi:hypothetical protein